MTIEVSDLEVFLTVVREGSFGRAAASRMVSQPAVSERMARLERTVGATLFTRSTRGVTLSGSGERLVPYAERTIRLLAEARETVRVADRPTPVRIAVHTTFAHRAVPIVLEAFDGEQRNVKVRDAHSDEIVTMLLDGVIDIGFVLPGARPAGLRFERLADDPIVAVCAPSHPLARRRAVTLEAVTEHRLALNRWGSGAERFVEQLSAAGMSDEHLTECSDGVTAVRLARLHGHIALVTKSIAEEELDAGRLIELSLRPRPRWTVPLALAYRRADHATPTITAVRDVLRRARQPERPR
jgi:DNA-binding transcriptional LysR family regulator